MRSAAAAANTTTDAVRGIGVRRTARALFARSRSPSESVEPSEPFANAVPTRERLARHLQAIHFKRLALFYSLRSAVRGSIRAARRAGSTQAAKVTHMVITRIPIKVTGSCGSTWYRILRMTRVIANAPAV